MPTFALQTRAASGHDEVEELKSIFHGAKNVVRECLNTESYPLDPLTGVAGTCIEVNLMDSRFDILLTVDALETEERLADAQVRVDQICRRLGHYTSTRNKIGVWLNLEAHKFWASTYTLEG